METINMIEAIQKEITSIFNILKRKLLKKNERES